VMELLEGRTLDEEIRTHGRLDVERAVPIFTAICSAIEAGHRRGVIHRDLKPANVMLARMDGSASETVKVLDFGLAAILGAGDAALTKKGVILGSLSYMAPEQLAGDPADERTDVFSLGVMLYEMLTGTLPYRAVSAIERIGEILRRAHVPVGDLAPDVPSELAAAVDRALAFAPAERHASVEDLARHTGASVVPGPPPRPRSDLATTLDAARVDATLVSPLVPMEIEAHDMVLAHADPSLAETAYAGADDESSTDVERGKLSSTAAYEPLVRSPGAPLAMTREASMAGVRRAALAEELELKTDRPPGMIAPAFVGRAAELEQLQGGWDPARRGAGRAALLVGDWGIGKTRTLAELRARLELEGAHTSEVERPLDSAVVDDLAAGAGSMVTLDGLVDASADALVALDRCAARVRDAGGLFVLAIAPPREEQALLARWVEEAESSRAWAVVRLPPLSEDEVRAWLVSAFPGARFTLADVREVVRVTGGRPQSLLEVAAQLVTRGLVVERGGRWVRHATAELEVPAAVRAEARARLTRISTRVRAFLEVCAILGDETTCELVAAVGELGAEELDELAGAAVARGLLVRGHRGSAAVLRFADRPVRELLRSEMRRDRSLALRGKAVAAIEQAQGADVRSAALALSEHLLDLGTSRRALGLALDAAEDALYAFRHDDAVTALGRAREAIAQLRAAGEAVTAGEVAKLDRLMGALDTRRGRYDDACEELRRAIANATDAGDTTLRVDALLDLADAHLGSGDHERAISSANAALVAARTLGDRFRWLTARTQLASYLLRQGRMDEATSMLVEVLKDTARFGLLRLHARAVRDLAWVRIKQGQFAEGEARAREALEVARASEDLVAERSAVSALAAALSEAGDSTSALPYQRQALEISRSLGARRTEAIDLANLGEALLDLGDAKGALDHFGEALDIFVEMGDRACEGDCRVNVGRALRAFGSRFEAVAMLDRGREICEETGRKEYAGIAWIELGEAHLTEGDAEDARQAFSRAAVLFEPMTSHLRWKADLGLARALAALGRPAEAAEHAERALEQLEARRGQHASGMDERGYERLLDDARALVASLGGAPAASE
ncbi:MAG: tetratricopeptide repeat protein, partial [Deltaproteobacteria bacterium]|nr:tetratricopeptide repeat protein [Deltaproteobacteria bacterium]